MTQARDSVHVVLAGSRVAAAEYAAELGLPRPGLPRRDAGTGRVQSTLVITPELARSGRARGLGQIAAVHRARGWHEVDMHVIRLLEESIEPPSPPPQPPSG